MKVRVPPEHRPPTRFGIITAKSDGIDRKKGDEYKVSGKYHSPKKGESYWNTTFQEVVRAPFDMTSPRVILEEVKP